LNVSAAPYYARGGGRAGVSVGFLCLYFLPAGTLSVGLAFHNGVGVDLGQRRGRGISSAAGGEEALNDSQEDKIGDVTVLVVGGGFGVGGIGG